MLFFDLCSCLPDSYCGWQPEGTVLQRESGMTGGLMRDVSLLLQCPLYLPRSPCRDRQEVREGRRWGQGKLCYAVWWLCNAVSPSRDLSQCSSALQGLPAPDTSSYFTRMHRTQAVQEIGCNRFVVILRKKKQTTKPVWNQHVCLSYGMVIWESPHLLSPVKCTDCPSKSDEGQNQDHPSHLSAATVLSGIRKNCKTAKQRRNLAMVILK